MKRAKPIAITTGNKVIAWSEVLHRNIAVIVTKVNGKSFQGETSGDNPEKLTGLSRMTAWTLKEFEKREPEEFYRMFPNLVKEQETTEAEEVVNSSQAKANSNSINGHLPPVEKLAEHDFKVGDRIIWQGKKAEVTQVKPQIICVLTIEGETGWIKDPSDLEHDGSWNPADFGDLEFLPEPDGQLNLLEPLTNEPPDPDDFLKENGYRDLAAYNQAWDEWKSKNKAVSTSDGDCPKLGSVENNSGLTNLKIDAIEVLEEMQPRMFGLNHEAVNHYCDRMENGENPPPVIVYKIDGRNILAAGFHRLAATKQAGKPYISAEIRHGTWAEAKIFSATSNKNNGLQMEKQDIQKAINLYLLGLDELPENDLRRKQSLREIANAIGCSHTYISKVKAQIAFEQKVKEFNLVKGARFKHKELGSCGAIFACYKTTETIILEWDIHDGNRYTGQMSVEWFLRDFEQTDLPKQEAPQEAPKTVNSVQTFTSVENETKAKAKSLGLSSSKNGVFPECKDPGDGNCLQADRNTPPDLEAPPPGQYYEVKTERIVINPDDLVIGILSNINQLKPDHIKSLFDAIASRIPDELLIEEAQKRSAVVTELAEVAA